MGGGGAGGGTYRLSSTGSSCIASTQTGNLRKTDKDCHSVKRKQHVMEHCMWGCGSLSVSCDDPMEVGLSQKMSGVNRANLKTQHYIVPYIQINLPLTEAIQVTVADILFFF